MTIVFIFEGIRIHPKPEIEPLFVVPLAATLNGCEAFAGEPIPKQFPPISSIYVWARWINLYLNLYTTNLVLFVPQNTKRR